MQLLIRDHLGDVKIVEFSKVREFIFGHVNVKPRILGLERELVEVVLLDTAVKVCDLIADSWST